MLKFGILALVIIITALGGALLPISEQLQATSVHDELQHIHSLLAQHNADTTAIFATSNLCENCHGYDLQQFALIDEQGNDVNMFDDWQASMMANSAKDPFWLAKISHENAVNPQHSVETETKCTSCHAPLGQYKAKFEGAEHYSIADMLSDSFGLDGVSCGACHHISDENIGHTFSGEINFDTSRVAFGPHLFPFSQPMTNFVGFEPKFSTHILDAGICAPCHTLLTPSVDIAGNPTGSSFVEQATYHEWLNSIYNSEDVSCQACHLPVIEGKVKIASGIGTIQPRAPFGLHEMVGANTFMLKLMKEHRQTLDIPAEDMHFDSTIAATFEMLQTKSIDLELSFHAEKEGHIYFKLNIKNKAGHKFPSGYPSRRAFVHFIVYDENGNPLFETGNWDSSYELVGKETDLEFHYDTIQSESEVQIYELVSGDVNGAFTSVLERGFQALKDNRLPPIGFSKWHPAYDTTRIVGMANEDMNFNIESGIEGSGTDDLYIKIPLNGYLGNVTAQAQVYYQSLPPGWMKEMFDTSTPEIDQFKNMYDNADQSPVLVQGDTLIDILVGTTSTKELEYTNVIIYPNPNSGSVNIMGIDNDKINHIAIFNTSGQRFRIQYDHTLHFGIPDQPGLYLLSIELNNGTRIVRKIQRE